MIIKNAGFMWHRKFVNWKKKELIGHPEEGKDYKFNFADQTAIYGLYDRNNICIYIGQAGSGDVSGLYERLKDHTNDYLFCMWERFSWYGFYSVKALKEMEYESEYNITTDINEVMTTLETIAIHLMLPRHNLSMGDDIKKIQWYYQEEEYKDSLKDLGTKDVR